MNQLSSVESISSKKHNTVEWYTVTCNSLDSLNVCPITHWIFFINHKPVYIPRIINVKNGNTKKSIIIENRFPAQLRNLFYQNNKSMALKERKHICSECAGNKKAEILGNTGNYCYLQNKISCL